MSSQSQPSFLSTLNFQSCLGYGAFGIVLQAIHSPSKVVSAVKFVFLTDTSTTKDRAMIHRECTLATGFNHENVVKILKVEEKRFTALEIENIFTTVSKNDKQLLSRMDSFIAEAKRYSQIESTCLQMELCGETLRNWLNQKHPARDPKTQFAICHGVIQGLKYLHDNKIIHRDLKPENIMFSKSGFTLPVKIGDFSLCRILHSPESQVSHLTSRAGTAMYMAPEVFTNDYSFQADYFSLGLIIWEVCQPIKPDKLRNLFDRLVNDKEESLIIVNPASPWIKELILQLTNRKKSERTASLETIVGLFKPKTRNDSPDLFPSTVDELVTSLQNVKSGGKIILGKNVYKGSFVLDKSAVEIVGQIGTVLEGSADTTCLEIRGDNCIISGVKVIVSGNEGVGIQLIGSNNAISNIDISGGWTCVCVTGNDNKLKDLHIFGTGRGLKIGGCRNIACDVDLQDIATWGISIGGRINTISQVTGSNVKTGIRVDGSQNTLDTIALDKGNEEYGFEGVWLHSAGLGNKISNLTCTGYSRDGIEVCEISWLFENSE